MSGHGPNLISFTNEKIKIGHPEILLNPHLSTSDNISSLSYPLLLSPTPPEGGRQMCIMTKGFHFRKVRLPVF